MNKTPPLHVEIFDSDINPKDITSPSRYEHIYDHIKKSIEGQKLEPGTLLLESPLAKLFSTSRVPVRRALTMLHKEDLISTFDGRGYLVGNSTSLDPSKAPKKVELANLLLSSTKTQIKPDFASHSERLVNTLEDVISLSIIFGHFSISEQEAAKTFGVSRGSIREALNRLREREIIEKNNYSNWLCGPLTTEAVLNDYEIRQALEPLALQQSIEHIPMEWLDQAIDQTQQAINNKHNCSPAMLYNIEKMLHVELLQHTSNKKILSIINRSHTPLIVNNIFFQAFKITPDDESLEEHLEIFQLLKNQHYAQASMQLAHHLNLSKKRVVPRLKALSVLPEPLLPSYMHKIS